MNTFCEKHHGNQMISVVIWRGFYLAYLGFMDPKHVKMLGDDPIPMKSRVVAPHLDLNITLYGFDTGHIWDTNIGPNGEFGFERQSTVGDDAREPWTKDKVFKTLHDIADEVLATR